jgi:hypothetical protein
MHSDRVLYLARPLRHCLIPTIDIGRQVAEMIGGGNGVVDISFKTCFGTTADL